MYGALFAVQTVLLFQLLLVAVAWDGRRLTLDGLLGIGVVVAFISAPVGLLFVPILLTALLLLVVMTAMIGAAERRRRLRRG